MVERILNRVDLPPPLGPRRPKISPWATERENSSRAPLSPERWERWETSTITGRDDPAASGRREGEGRSRWQGGRRGRGGGSVPGTHGRRNKRSNRRGRERR